LTWEEIDIVGGPAGPHLLWYSGSGWTSPSMLLWTTLTEVAMSPSLWGDHLAITCHLITLGINLKLSFPSFLTDSWQYPTWPPQLVLLPLL